MKSFIDDRMAMAEEATQPVRSGAGFQCGRCWQWYETAREAADCADEDRTQFLTGEAEAEIVKAGQGF